MQDVLSSKPTQTIRTLLVSGGLPPEYPEVGAPSEMHLALSGSVPPAHNTLGPLSGLEREREREQDGADREEKRAVRG